MSKRVYGQHLVGAKQLLSTAKAIQADADALGLGAPGDPERLRLLGAVAIAARGNARKYLALMGCKDMTFAEYLSTYPMRLSGRAVLEALAALEEV